MSPINLNEFQRSLTDNYVRTSQILHTAFGAGIFAFAVVVYVVYTNQPGDLQETDAAVQTVRTLTIVQLLFASSCCVVAQLMFNRFLALKQGPLSHARTVASCLMTLRTATIVRLAMLEGPAFFGLVVCLLASMNGVLHSYPLYWINAISPAILLAVVIITFPTREKLEQTFSEKMTAR